MKFNYHSIMLITLLFAMFGTSAAAQGLFERAAKRASQRLEEKTEERIDRKVDDAIDKSLDNAESSVERGDKAPSTSESRSQTRETRRQERDERSQRRMENIMGGLGISAEPLDLEDEYAFHSSLRMNIKSYDENGDIESDGDFVTYISKDDKFLAYEFVSGEFQTQGNIDDKGLIIIDSKNKATVILSEERGKKTGVAYGLGAWNQMTGGAENALLDYDEENEESYEAYRNANFKKTGRTKTIEGYRCEEWEFSDENGEGVFWISSDYNADSRHLFGSIFTVNAIASGHPSGFIMESEFKDLNTGEKNLMKVTEINDNANIRFDLQQYDITNLGSLGMKE